MRSAQGTAVIAAVTAHADDHSRRDELFHDADLGAVRWGRVREGEVGRNAEKQRGKAGSPHSPASRPTLPSGLTRAKMRM